MKSDIQTLVINNFGGTLTRQNYGDINSGMAKFDTSWGYNPFYKPNQLTWFANALDLTSTINGLIIAGVSRVESGETQNYVITSTGHLVKIAGNGANHTDLATLTSGTPTFAYGADIEFFGATNTLYISHDKGVTSIKTDGSSETVIGTWDATHFTPIVTRRSLQQFIGNLYVTNSDPSVTYANNIAEIDSTGTVSTYAKLSPSLPTGTYIRDLDVSSDLTYMMISSSLVASELLAPVNDTGNAGSGASSLYLWNGTDVGVTAGTSLPNFGVTALQTFGNSQMMFMYDQMGAALYDGNKKRITLRNNKSPMPGATCSAGNFVTWMAPEVYRNLDNGLDFMYGSLYYYGQLDENSPAGLYRMFRQSSAIGGVIYQTPFQKITTNRYVSSNSSGVVTIIQNGIHLYSFTDYSGSGGSTVAKFYSFDVVPPDVGDNTFADGGTCCDGVYETQTQLFSQRIALSQIRVYTEPTVASSGFDLDLIGSNGQIIDNGSFSYTYAVGTDVTKLQGSLERINFNPSTLTTYAVGIRITNTGSFGNTVINKIEVDYGQAGK